MEKGQKEIPFTPQVRFWLRKPRRQPSSYLSYEATAKKKNKTKTLINTESFRSPRLAVGGRKDGCIVTHP